jgi:hypothetical protein
MRAEMGELNPVHVARTTARSLSAVAAAGGLPVRRLEPTVRRYLFAALGFALSAMLAHRFVLVAVSQNPAGWAGWATALLTFPAEWAQPLIAGLGGSALVVMAIRTAGFTRVHPGEATALIPSAVAAAVGTLPLILFLTLFVLALLALALLGVAILALFFMALVASMSQA